MKLAKSTLLFVIIGFVLALGIFSKTEAKTFTFPKVIPDTNPIHLLFPVGEHVTLLKTGATTDGRYTLANFLIPPGGGPLPHIHHREDEWFYVVDGDLQLQMGFTNYPSEKSPPGNKADKETFHTINAKAGTLIYTPKYHLHRFENIGKKPVNLLTVWAPSGIENYFQEAAQLIRDPSNPPALDSEKHKKLFVSLAPKYGISQSSSFEQYVKQVDNKIPTAMLRDNHSEELFKLLSPDIAKH